MMSLVACGSHAIVPFHRRLSNRRATTAWRLRLPDSFMAFADSTSACGSMGLYRYSIRRNALALFGVTQRVLDAARFVCGSMVFFRHTFVVFGLYERKNDKQEKSKYRCAELPTRQLRKSYLYRLSTGRAKDDRRRIKKTDERKSQLCASFLPSAEWHYDSIA
jgi:hypothetical protein